MTPLDYSGYHSPDFLRAVQSGEKTDIVEVRTGSDSDFPKIQEVLDGLKQDNIPYILRILSAHRTAEEMMEAANAFPELLLPHALRSVIDRSNLRVKFSIAAAGGSAHIAGMTASETQRPIIALPVASSSSRLIDASFSMINMPPGIPNGFVPDNKMGVAMSQKLYHLDLPESANTISLGDIELSESDQALLQKLGVSISENASVNITTQDTHTGQSAGIHDGFNIIIPTVGMHGPMSALAVVQNYQNLKTEGVYMGMQREGNVNNTNAILYAAQILGIFNPNIKRNLERYRMGFSQQVRTKDLQGVAEQFGISPLKMRLLTSGLWPADKKTITLERGNEELESLGYELFYKGKNADLYLVPVGENEPLQVLMVRSDRTSVFDIKLDLEIEGKGEIQTQISKLGAQFAEERGFPICFSDLPSNIPTSLEQRCQMMELCRPLTMEIDGKEEGLELIFRNYNAGSLYNKYYKEGKENPYGLELPEGMEEWGKFPEPIFTPTTKDAQDTPVNSQLVRDRFPDLISRLEDLFREFTAFMSYRGYIVVDTKVEVFINAQGELVLGDEIFTPESSRFIKREDFEAGRYISADKQIIRNLGKEFGWEERLAHNLVLFPELPRYLNVSAEVTPEKRQEVLDGYSDIYKAMIA